LKTSSMSAASCPISRYFFCSTFFMTVPRSMGCFISSK
jgi:hypothetical protein